MAGGHKATVTVVVSGVPQEVSINLEQRVEHLMRQALKQAGIEHPNLAEWKLRFAEGGSTIDPDQKIGDAGITPSATLFLDPDEGGGGQVAVTPIELPPLPESPTLVDPEISRAKLARELRDWEANAKTYRRRGWFLLETEDLDIDVGFAASIPLGLLPDSASLPLCVRFNFDNYDLWPPSVQFIDPLTARPLERPRLQAFDFSRRDAAGNPEVALVGGHPETGRFFLCKRGVREYHSHFEHSGDDWLLYRGQGIGTLAQLCNVLWHLTTRTVVGVQLIGQRVPQGDGAQINFGFEYRQDDVDALVAQMPPQLQMQAQAELPITALPQEVQMQLQQFLNQQQG